MIKIEDLIPKYGALNKFFQNIIDSKKIAFDEQVYITDFFNMYNNIESFEKMITTLVIEIFPEKYNVLLKNLYSEINSLQESYNQNRSLFDNLDILNVCKDKMKKFDDSIEDQTKQTQNIQNKCTYLNCKIESIVFKKHTSLEFEELSDEHSYQKSLLKLEETELKKLWDEKHKLIRYSRKYLDNIFYNFFEINTKNSLILERYLGIIADNGKNLIFDLELTGKLYKLCNDELFENTTEMNFSYNLNLLPTNKKLEVKRENQYMVLHLVKILQFKLKKKNTDLWKKEFLEKLNLLKIFDKKAANLSYIINPESPRTTEKKYIEYKKFDTELKELIK